MPVGLGLTDEVYIGTIRETMPDAIDPDLVVYNAGSDPSSATRWPTTA